MSELKDMLADADTVAVCVPDNCGRLIGKRQPVARWPALRADGLAMPNFHLVTGLENRPYGDLEVTGEHTGFRNGLLMPIEETAFRSPSEPRTVLFLAEALDGDRRPVEEAPRRILARQIERLSVHGLSARMASELEFYLFRQSYADAHTSMYRDLVPFYHRHADNDILVSGFDEPFFLELRKALEAAHLEVDQTQGEGGTGQYEINVRPAPPLQAADQHVTFKHVVKAAAHRAGCAACFMAKPFTDDAGSSSHIHISLQKEDGSSAVGRDGQLDRLGAAFLAGLIAFTPELTLLHAPYANSYRRLVPGSFAPANASWAWDNRMSMVRITGTGPNMRFEFRLPGADVNPYFSYATILAAGLEGIDRGLEPPEPAEGNAYRAKAPQLPRDLTEAVRAFSESQMAELAFTAPVHRHLCRLAQHELSEVRRLVADWELRRGFESA